MRLQTVGAVIKALFYSRKLEHEAINGGGGLMLVAEPESLKSAMLNVLRNTPSVEFRDDVNVQTLNSSIRPAIARGAITALVFPEFQKVLERRDETAKNTMGHLRSFVHDGIFESAHDTAMAIQAPATCLLFGALTEKCFNDKVENWNQTGFFRRILWSHYRVLDKDKELIKMAHRLNKLLTLFTTIDFQLPHGSSIPSTATRAERLKIDKLLLVNADNVKVPYRVEPERMLYAIHDVLKWQVSQKMIEGDAMSMMEDFIPSLGSQAILEFPKRLWQVMEELEREQIDAEDAAVKRAMKQAKRGAKNNGY